MRILLQIVLVALGSAGGGLTRWGVGTAAARLLGTNLPYGTFFINITGSLFLGWISTVLTERLSLDGHPWIRPDDLRLMIAVGFVGSYTTFSTFEWETNGLIRDGESLAGMGYMIASVVLGLLAVRLGIVLALSK
ncbi:MAG TPA: CrcB family protein [Pirellulales bacterium]|nr:CrcB family protein [Pirellulales bacterium]